MYVYSAANNAFFETARVPYYVSCGWVINDAVTVTHETFIEFSREKIGYGRSSHNGLPCWVEIVRTPDEIYQESYSTFITEVNRLLNERLSKSELTVTPAKVSVNLASPEDVSSLKQLLAEIDELEDIIDSGVFVDIYRYYSQSGK